MRINDNEEGTVDMDMLEENLKVIQGVQSMQWIFFQIKPKKLKFKQDTMCRSRDNCKHLF